MGYPRGALGAGDDHDRAAPAIADATDSAVTAHAAQRGPCGRSRAPQHTTYGAATAISGVDEQR